MVLATPEAGDFTWVYQGTGCNVASVTGGIQFQALADTYIHMLGEVPPSPPWTALAGFIPSISFWTGLTGGPSLPQLCDGICLSDGTKFIVWYADYPAQRFHLMTATDYQAFTLVELKAISWPTHTVPPILWLKITDDGANRNYYFTQHPESGWLLAYTEASGTFLTPTKVGLLFWPEAGGAGTWNGGVFIDWQLIDSIV